MIRGLNHLTIAVSELERSFDFYKNILGLQPFMKQPRGAYFLAGEFWFCLEVDSETRRHALPEDTHFAFSVDKSDFEKLQSRIIGSGARSWKENRSEGESLYFLDPDYHKLEIHYGDWRSRLRHYSEHHEMSSFIIGHRKTEDAVALMPPEVQLISFRPQFLEAFLRWRKEPSSIAHNPLVTRPPEHTLRYLENEGSDLEEFDRVNSFRWFIEYEGKPVGTVSLKNINRMMMFAEIAYGLSENYHGRGIATEAVRLMIHEAFAVTPLRKLIAHVHDKNEASLRLLNRLGFTKEGLLRSHFLINGKPCNEVVFGLLREEWHG